MIAGFENLLWTLFSYLKTLLFTLFTGATPQHPKAIKPVNNEKPKDASSFSPDAIVSRVTALKDSDEIFSLLHKMIALDGAGSWPPRCSSDINAWPAALRSYHEIYQEMAPMLAVPEPSLDDDENIKRRTQFRTRMTELLDRRVDLAAVEALLSRAEAGDVDAIPADVFNRFFSCIAMSRHAFRWATIPAVKVAQAEKHIPYPRALALPWPFLNRRYAFTSPAGNVMTNFVLSWDWNRPSMGPTYPINVGRSPAIERAEYWFSFMLVETERLALPVYADMAAALAHHARGERRELLAALRRVRDGIRVIAKVFYDNMTSDKVEPAVWMSWVQGFHAYGATEDGVVEPGAREYDGVSANQLPFFHVVDAFLGITRTYLDGKEMRSNILGAQRALSEGVRRRCFRVEAKEAGDEEVEGLMREIARVVRVWRAAHKVRIIPYFEQPAPERMIMTAGKSVLETKGLSSMQLAMDFMNKLLGDRMQETV